ncbi:unnamed protein product [Coregonus sp. 'balchen']|nr:unnamed protein product [Coregonus sp. 'balchen']
MLKQNEIKKYIHPENLLEAQLLWEKNCCTDMKMSGFLCRSFSQTFCQIAVSMTSTDTEHFNSYALS